MTKYLDYIRATVLLTLLAIAVWALLPEGASSAATHSPALPVESTLLAHISADSLNDSSPATMPGPTAMFLFGTGLISAAGFMNKFTRLP